MMIDPANKPASQRFRDSVPLLERPEELRARAEQDGYLFFRNVLEHEKLLSVRMQMLSILERRGLLKVASPLMDGIADEENVKRLPDEIANGFGVPIDLYREVQKLESFHALAHLPALLHIYRVLFGEEVFPHPRNIARIMLPHPSVKPTPPHQDFIHIQGSPHTWTAWFPLGDCPLELGGLAILEGSHKLGVLGVTGHQGGAGGLETILCGTDLEWAEDDYGLGDVVIFHSHTVL